MRYFTSFHTESLKSSGCRVGRYRSPWRLCPIPAFSVTLGLLTYLKPYLFSFSVPSPCPVLLVLGVRITAI